MRPSRLWTARLALGLNRLGAIRHVQSRRTYALIQDDSWPVHFWRPGCLLAGSSQPAHAVWVCGPVQCVWDPTPDVGYVVPGYATAWQRRSIRDATGSAACLAAGG